MELANIEINKITKDEKTQPRAVIDNYVVDLYRQDMLSGDEFPPVMVFSDNDNYYLADGWHRILAAEQCGHKTIQCAVKDGTLREAILYSCAVNADHGKRRSDGDKRRAVKKLLKDPGWAQWSDNKIAQTCRVSVPFVGKLRKEFLTINVNSERTYTTKHGTTAAMNTSNIGKKNSDTEPKNQEDWYQQWSEDNKKIGLDAFGDPTPEYKPKYSDLDYRLFTSPISELTEHIEADTIDAIITDPPYPKDYIYTFGELAKAAATILKPGGVLVALSGHLYLPKYLELISEYLNYHWLGNYYMPTPPHYHERNRLVTSRSKPIIIATKGAWIKKHFIDTVINEKPDKEHHEWGQGITGFTQLVENFTNPNDTVCDPFLGGGTTAIATLNLGRYFVGSDISEEEVEKTRRRIEAIK